MTLIAGTKLGPYEIQSPLGAGGMGEVYKARDTRLDRTVAIKVLPSHLSDNPDLKQRFEREAKAISSLNHPNICTLHDIGTDGGTDFLVMEYLEGETLADRLRRGRLQLDQVFAVGMEIADALDKAHRQGVVHRDLKPGNIMLTKSGAKLMDFGLAKGTPLAMAASSVGPLTPSTPTMSMAALSSPVSPLTQKGQVVGTFQYIAPEVLQGAEADARSDLFAFGCVLYEMTTGRQAFEGKSQLGVMTAILEKDPEPVRTAEKSAPEGFEQLVTTCLAKDPEQRFASAHDVMLELRWLQSAARRPQERTRQQRSPVRLAVWSAIVVVVAIAAAVAGYWAHRSALPVIQAVIPTPDNVTLDATGDFAGPAVISPDGKAIAFVAHSASSPKALWVRRLADKTSQVLEGTQDAAFPFWSPDSRYIAFFANGKLNKVSAGGGPVLAVADAPSARGGSWGSGDVIIFEPDFQSPLMRVSAHGGAVTAVTTIDSARHTTHRWPWFLPDGKHFLFLATNHNGGVRDQNGVYMGSLDNKETHMVVTSDSGAQYADGYLLFHTQNALMAQRFDPVSGKLSGDATVVVDRVAHDPGVWRTIFSVSNSGVLAYQGGAAASGSELVMVDLTGKVLGHIGERANYSTIRVSRDGKRLVTAVGDPKADLWTYDLSRGTATRLTFETGTVDNPSWSADGKDVYYNVFPGMTIGNTASASSATIYVKRADGSGGSK
ncbi:MAG: protein kinase domain-containing protein, partial [Terriglobales bacterium]